jgi:N-acetylmuramoyl-L-alanine amidase
MKRSPIPSPFRFPTYGKIRRTLLSGSAFFFFVWILELAGCAGSAVQKPTPAPALPFKLDVVYPRCEGRDTVIVLPRVDSTFAFGSVSPPGSRIFINGTPAQVWENGAFLGYFPLPTPDAQIVFSVISPEGETLRKTLALRFPPLQTAKSEPETPHPLNARLPALLTVTRDFAAMRNIPGGAYTLFPPRGAVALADSFVAPYFRVRLGDDLHAWVEDRFVELDTASVSQPTTRPLPTTRTISRIAVISEGKAARVIVPSAGSLLFDIRETSDSRGLLLRIYGADSRINRIDYDPRDMWIREIRWQQIEDGVLELYISLASRLWGYSSAYEDDDLILRIRKPLPIQKKVLKNLVIVLDPGHGGAQPGAVGPTRLAEKEPNLRIAGLLKALLEREGARVYMTRTNDDTVELYDRIRFAVQKDADILLSLHNNALSDGENPFVKHGSAVYYYQPFSLELARSLHDHLLSATNLNDHGLYYQNLALVRPTEMPAVLLECAFMMYPPEEMLLRDDAFLQRTARGIAAGIREFLLQQRNQP